MDLQQSKNEIAAIAKKMYLSGMVNIFEGNISVRAKDRFLITPSQQSKENMTEDMIIELDEEGKVLNPSDKYKPSSESQMHLAAYKLRSDVNAVVHNHSPYATAFAVAGRAIKSTALTEMLGIFGEIPIVPYGTPGTERIYAGFPEHLKYNYAVLLANHGVLAVGETLFKAYSIAEAVEKIAQTLLYAELLGGGKSIPEKEAEMIREHGFQRRKKIIETAQEAVKP